LFCRQDAYDKKQTTRKRDREAVAAGTASAKQAARSGEPLTAMLLLKALAVRCARDPDALLKFLLHVCTALHVHNKF
jgi:hypothetical protein